MKSATPQISVVIPALNEAAYLPRTLASLARQTYQNFEVIVVDNGSTDATAQLAAKHGADVVHQPQPGVCAARDTGTRHARGQIVVSTDADTQFDTDWLANIAQAFQDPTVSLVAGPPQFVGAPIWGHVYSRLLFGAVGLGHRLSGRLVYASAANLAFRRQQWDGYNTRLTQGGDELYVLRQLRHQGGFVWLAHNPVHTSSRRLKRGLLYNLTVTFLGYYAGDYLLSHLTQRSLLGSYPEIRDQKSQQAWGWKLASFVIVLGTLLYGFESHPGMAHALAKRRHDLRHLQRISWHIDADGRKF